MGAAIRPTAPGDHIRKKTTCRNGEEVSHMPTLNRDIKYPQALFFQEEMQTVPGEPDPDANARLWRKTAELTNQAAQGQYDPEQDRQLQAEIRQANAAGYARHYLHAAIAELSADLKFILMNQQGPPDEQLQNRLQHAQAYRRNSEPHQGLHQDPHLDETINGISQLRRLILETMTIARIYRDMGFDEWKALNELYPRIKPFGAAMVMDQPETEQAVADGNAEKLRECLAWTKGILRFREKEIELRANRGKPVTIAEYRDLSLNRAQTQFLKEQIRRAQPAPEVSPDIF